MQKNTGFALINENIKIMYSKLLLSANGWHPPVRTY